MPLPTNYTPKTPLGAADVNAITSAVNALALKSPQRVILTVGSGNWTVPAGVTSIDVQVQGPGGNGGLGSSYGNGGSGGSGGGYAFKKMAVTGGQVIPWVVGGPGTASSFNTTIIGNSGLNGLVGYSGNNTTSVLGVVGGTATGGDVNIQGGASSYGVCANYGGFCGMGGSARLGISGLGGAATNNSYAGYQGSAGTGYGGGGGGGYYAGPTNVGAPGVIIIDYVG